MHKVILFMIVGLLLVAGAVTASAQDDKAVYDYSLWIGGHYTDFQDYTKKVGEYRLDANEGYPEIRINGLTFKDNRSLRFNGYYFDKYNTGADITGTVGDVFRGAIDYRSLVHNKGQDLLANLEAREYLGGGMVADPTSPGDSIEAGGGKILTHELADAGADYRKKRYDVNSNMSLLVSHKANLKLIMAHRSIIEKGSEQKLSTMHCFSCHVTSETAKIDRQTHQIMTGFEGGVEKVDFGYTFGYRTFKSNSPDNQIMFDPAVHPVNGGSGAEFSSREIYQDEMVTYGILPETKKMAHKVKLKGDVGTGRLAAAFTYSTVENTKENYAGVDLKSEAFGGQVNYTAPLSKTSRLIAKVSGTRIKNDDPFVDLPTFREGMPGPQVDFDFVRYSSLDRKELDGSAEIITRLNTKTTLSVLAGYDYTSRYDYPEFEADYATKTLIGQIKAKYRQGMKFTLDGKYRFEKTSDPFTSARGLFEPRLREELQLPHPNGFRFRFYYEREPYRYQDITTVPTDRHEFEAKSTIRPNSKVNLALGFKTVYDKNGDLDSLDVKHLSVQPNAFVTLMPSQKWTVVGGYTFNYAESRGPVTVALFDG